MITTLLVWAGSLLACSKAAELLQNGDCETMDHWHCYDIHCELTTDHHSGRHAIKATNRSNSLFKSQKHDYEGPIQSFSATPNFLYAARAYVKLLDDAPGKIGQTFDIEMDYVYADGSHHYKAAAHHPLVSSHDGWVLLQGDFKAPHHGKSRSVSHYLKEVRVKIQGPDPGLSFLVDAVSVTNIWRGTDWKAPTDDVINAKRKSDIHVHVTTSGNVDKNDVQIQVSAAPA
ncbi:hypothetical protein BaRGS_00004541 [Batillaria attramentaria]|uniref:CBM-cenC domain-containing protein n=1 Tax=Batillaria attramentaria TaxID=370345 RepID=A0ABD0LZ42_9CAEN